MKRTTLEKKHEHPFLQGLRSALTLEVTFGEDGLERSSTLRLHVFTEQNEEIGNILIAGISNSGKPTGKDLYSHQLLSDFFHKNWKVSLESLRRQFYEGGF